MEKPIPSIRALQSWLDLVPKVELHLHLEDRLGFSRPDLRTLLLNALSVCFHSDPAWQEIEA